MDLECSIARLLRTGIYASMSLLAVGVLLLLASGVSPLAGGPEFSAAGLVRDLLAGRPAGFIWLGLLALVVTPAGRVAGALVGYLRGGQTQMVAISVAILVVIALSVALALTPALEP